jgi:hypothetical protein
VTKRKKIIAPTTTGTLTSHPKHERFSSRPGAFSIWSAASIAAFDLLSFFQVYWVNRKGGGPAAALSMGFLGWGRPKNKSKAAMLAALQIENAPLQAKDSWCVSFLSDPENRLVA